MMLIFKGKMLGGERKFRSVEACEAFVLGVAAGCPESLHGNCAVEKVGHISPVTGNEVRAAPRTIIGGYEDLQKLAAQWALMRTTLSRCVRASSKHSLTAVFAR